MRIEYKTGGQRTVRASIGRRLVRVGIAREVETERSGTYMTRDMRAETPRLPRPFSVASEVVAGIDRAVQPPDASGIPINKQTTGQSSDLAELRAQYQDAVGKRAFHGWDAETLRAKISEAAQ